MYKYNPWLIEYVELCQKHKKYKGKQMFYKYEKHHVFPKHIFGLNGFIVKLKPIDHFKAHYLLWKAFEHRYGKDHPHTIKAKSAFIINVNSKFESKFLKEIYNLFESGLDFAIYPIIRIFNFNTLDIFRDMYLLSIEHAIKQQKRLEKQTITKRWTTSPEYNISKWYSELN